MARHVWSILIFSGNDKAKEAGLFDSKAAANRAREELLRLNVKGHVDIRKTRIHSAFADWREYKNSAYMKAVEGR